MGREQYCLKANFCLIIWEDLGHDEYKLLSDILNNGLNVAILTTTVL